MHALKREREALAAVEMEAGHGSRVPVSTSMHTSCHACSSSHLCAACMSIVSGPRLGTSFLPPILLSLPRPGWLHKPLFLMRTLSLSKTSRAKIVALLQSSHSPVSPPVLQQQSSSQPRTKFLPGLNPRLMVWGH